MLPAFARYLVIFFKMHLLHLRTQLEYEADLWIGLAGVVLTQLANFTFIWALFGFLPSLAGWTFWEAAFLYGLLALPKGLLDLFCAGVWHVRYHVQTAGFDRMLVRPVPVILQLFSSGGAIHGIGHVALGVYLIVRATRELGSAWTLGGMFTLGACVLNSLLVLSALYLAANSTALWNGGGENALPQLAIHVTDTVVQVPISLYDRTIQSILTLIPFAFISYYPAAVMLGKPLTPSWIAAVLPFSGILSWVAMLALWRVGFRRYESAGH